MNLNEIMNESRSDKGNMVGAAHNYTPIYESWFEEYRDREVNFMEVGVDFGQSVRGWSKYFTKAKIYMLDYTDFSHLNNSRVTYFKANQSNIEELKIAAEQVDGLDFFIDDGGHCMDHQQLTFSVFFPKMKNESLFFIEDTHTSNWDPRIHPTNSPGYCYGQPIMINEDRSSSTINVFKKFQRTGKFHSPFLSEEVNLQLQEMIDEVIIYGDNNEIVEVDSNLENSIVKHGVILIKRK
jgi:hypothetical protein